MSRKNKFKKEKVGNCELVTKQERSRENKNPKEEYKMKSDFLSLGIIFTVFLGFLAGLYYYDQQSNILKITAEQLMNLF